MNPAPAPLQALGICLEEYEYPYPVRFLSLGNDLQQVAMAYLLDHLGVGNVAVLGHSTGGMTAARFTLMYPDRVTLGPDYPRWARAAALTFQMIYQQPVRYEYPRIAPPVLLVVGAEDHTVPLGQYAQPAEAARLGDFTALSAAAARDIPGARRVVIRDCGHIPHLEHPSQFLTELMPFLAS